MFKYFEYGFIFICLMSGFVLLMWRTEILSRAKEGFIRARSMVEEQDKQVRLLRRKNLTEFQKKNSVWLWLESQIEFSGLKRLIPGASAGRLLVADVVIGVALFMLGIILKGAMLGCLLVILLLAGEFFGIAVAKARNQKKVNEEMPKFLDFLGNYSMSSGELITIFSQISRYLEDPIRSVLEECEAESRISGDSQMAIAAMADKIEHPQFRQFIRNIEITSRFSADFSALVSDSRKSMREYLSSTRERKSLLREAGINMGLLLIMSVVVLLIVNVLIDGSVWSILFGTLVGHLALIGMGIILALFTLQVFSMNK